MINIRNERRDITIDSIDIKRIRDNEQLCVYTFKNLMIQINYLKDKNCQRAHARLDNLNNPVFIKESSTSY